MKQNPYTTNAVSVNKNVVQLHYNISGILIQHAQYLISNNQNAEKIIKSIGQYIDLVSSMDDNVCLGEMC